MPNIGITELLLLLPLLAAIILPLVALVFLFRDKRPGSETAIWALVILVATYLGPIVYLVWRTRERPHPGDPGTAAPTA
ncbi:PLD nuclease N-terminal domain-containing protein [Corynebacterium mastitidis]|uniref:PLD nuclease N-terminal domain-containing protein n=1 Tax=Corynebacterium mastitidis TaxID=161890 RepID=A0ABU8P0F3_9CORY